MEWLSSLGVEVLWTVVAALAALTILDDALADGARRVPWVGPVLAPIVRRLSARFREWLGERVPSAADRIVRQVEADTAGAPGAVKLKLATAALLDAEPGLIEPEARAAVQAAVDRAKAAPSLEDRRLDELEATLTARVPGDAVGRAE